MKNLIEHIGIISFLQGNLLRQQHSLRFPMKMQYNPGYYKFSTGKPCEIATFPVISYEHAIEPLGTIGFL